MKKPQNINCNAFESEKHDTEKSKFYTKTGWLSHYALACGYMESISRCDRQATLEMDSACYHVRAYDYDKGERLLWDSYHTLSEARAAFSNAIKFFL